MTVKDEFQTGSITDIVRRFGNDRHRLIDILREVQSLHGCVSGEMMESIADALGIYRVEVEGVVSFYHFLTSSPKGWSTIYLSRGAVPSMNGVYDIARILEREVGKGFGESGENDLVGLEWTNCIGMNDQEPAAIVEGVVVTDLCPETVVELVSHLKNGGDPSELSFASVTSNIGRKGEVIFSDRETGGAVRKVITMDPSEVLDEIKQSGLRGRGGAGFPCGLKWDFCLGSEGRVRYLLCNADEGEPGTFKDRVILTEHPELLIEGMVVAAYALGVEEGIIYLRGEYEYLHSKLDSALECFKEGLPDSSRDACKSIEYAIDSLTTDLRGQYEYLRPVLQETLKRIRDASEGEEVDPCKCLEEARHTLETDLRGEYAYLRPTLEAKLEELREAGLLGRNIAGLEGFNFDIRIQMGAGAYVCGEETALIESCEGKRGEPRDRPPYPVSRGYMGKPTVVNNVETLCCVARIIDKGSDWFRSIGTEQSTGTKLLSVSGDCSRPGVYEFPFGTTLEEILEATGGTDAIAFQVGGPSGECVAPKDFDRKIAFEDLPTGGSMIVIGPNRNLLDMVRDFMEFFVDESCGRCTPCRVGNTLLLNRIKKFIDGRGTRTDLAYLESLCNTISTTSRCGLGLTSPNPVLSVMRNFPEIFENILSDEDYFPKFNLEAAMKDGLEAAKAN